MWTRLRQTYKNDTSGQFALFFAASVPVLILGSGIAWDVGRASSAKTAMQDALDSSVIAAVVADSEPTQLDFETLYTDNNGNGSIETYAYSDVYTGRSVRAEATYEMPTSFAGIMGRESIPIHVKAEAKGPTSLSSVKLSVAGASGHWGKKIDVIGVSDGTETVINTVRYSVSIYNGMVSSSSFVAEKHGWVDALGYDHIYLRFQIDPDAYRFDEWCVLDGCPEKVFRTDQAVNSDRFFINGAQVPAGTVLDIDETIKCGEVVKHAWEDGGQHNPDIHYMVEGKCDAVSAQDVYLAR